MTSTTRPPRNAGYTWDPVIQEMTDEQFADARVTRIYGGTSEIMK